MSKTKNTVRKLCEYYIQSGTGEQVRFRGETVGIVGRSKIGGAPVFIWSQDKLRFKSSQKTNAYGMSKSLLNRLERKDVETVIVFRNLGLEQEKRVPLSRIRNGETLAPDNDAFHESKTEPQHLLRVES